MADKSKYDRIFLGESDDGDSWNYIGWDGAFMVCHEFLEELRQNIDGWNSLPQTPGNVLSLGMDALRLAGVTHRLEKYARGTQEYLRLGARAIAAAAARYISGGGPLRVELGRFGAIELPPIMDLGTEFGPAGHSQPPFRLIDPALIDVPDPMDVDAGPPQLNVSLRQIVVAYHAAFAVRDEPALQLLADVPMELFADKPPSAVERSYGLSHARGLQLLARGDIAGRELLLDALDGCNSPEMDQDERDYALLVVGPEIELAMLHAQSDEQADKDGVGCMTFDQSLRNALVMHRLYWRNFEPNPGEGRTDRQDTFIALGPLAWAAMRYPRLGVGIRSDYLPINVLKRPGWWSHLYEPAVMRGELTGNAVRIIADPTGRRVIKAGPEAAESEIDEYVGYVRILDRADRLLGQIKAGLTEEQRSVTEDRNPELHSRELREFMAEFETMLEIPNTKKGGRVQTGGDLDGFTDDLEAIYGDWDKVFRDGGLTLAEAARLVRHATIVDRAAADFSIHRL